MASGDGWTWTVPPTVIGRNIATRKERARAGLVALCQSHGGRLEGRVKDHSRWHDRTSNARQGIGNEVQVNGDLIEIIVYHTMEYGPYLETGTSRMPKLGVMDEEIVVTGAEVVEDAQKLLERLFG